jgi:hypothetical protein
MWKSDKWKYTSFKIFNTSGCHTIEWQSFEGQISSFSKNIPDEVASQDYESFLDITSDLNKEKIWIGSTD